eukprot:m.11530 g.11530  ORF g.11530 m.11530 type:complete len:332 (-) comp4038_c0_seq2:89-1084(-)
MAAEATAVAAAATGDDGDGDVTGDGSGAHGVGELTDLLGNVNLDRLSRVNGHINRMDLAALRRACRAADMSAAGSRAVLKRRLKEHSKQCVLDAMQGPARDRQASKWSSPPPEFDYICVIDFEATCEEGTREFPHEIIEWPIVLVNARTLKKEGEFHAFVKPVLNPVLSKFCSGLTGITQDQVDRADTFPEVLQRVEQWMTSKGLGTTHSFGLSSDGPWDFRNFLTLQCEISGISRPDWSLAWLDVRKAFSSRYNERCGVEAMLEHLGLQFEGRPHSGIDDTRNIARILAQLIVDGQPVQFNDRLHNHNLEVLKQRVRRALKQKAATSKSS